MDFWPTSFDAWLSIIGRSIVIGTAVGSALWFLLKAYINSEVAKLDVTLEKETLERKLADQRIEEKLVIANDTSHVAIGRADALQVQTIEQERQRIDQLHKLELSIKDQFHALEMKMVRNGLLKIKDD